MSKKLTIIDTREINSNTQNAQIIITPREYYKYMRVRRDKCIGAQKEAHDLAVLMFCQKNGLPAKFSVIKTKTGFCYIPDEMLTAWRYNETQNEKRERKPAQEYNENGSPI